MHPLWVWAGGLSETELSVAIQAVSGIKKCLCDVDRYLYCVTFSGKDMRGVESDWIKRDPEIFWLPHLPQIVLRQLVRMLNYRSEACFIYIS